jgi:5-methylcytosine-specific restriction endonuclease McrA
MKLQDIIELLKRMHPNQTKDFFDGAEAAINIAMRTDKLDYQRTKLLKLFSIKSELLTPLPRFDQKEYRRRRHREKYIPRQRKVYTNICIHCHIEFQSKRPNSKYCKPNHNPTHRERKRLSKRFNEKAKPPWVKWSVISDIYKKCPEGYQVDHIIPLNHPDVCGLHVPWNLQYLKQEDNLRKTNSWDGTYDNKSW